MRKPLYIYGAGGLGKEVLALTQATQDWKVMGFLDDGLKKGTKINGIEVIGGKDKIKSLNNINLILAFGSPFVKERVATELKSLPVQFPTIIHPSAILQDIQYIKMGPGCVITAACVLTTNIHLGNHVLVNLNTTIGHDSTIGDYSSIMPGTNVAGEVTVGKAVLIGSGSNILNRVVIGDNAIVGMGSVVIHNVASDCTVAGVPAKPIK